jgi:hypothetical protein
MSDQTEAELKEMRVAEIAALPVLKYLMSWFERWKTVDERVPILAHVMNYLYNWLATQDAASFGPLEDWVKRFSKFDKEKSA